MLGTTWMGRNHPAELYNVKFIHQDKLWVYQKVVCKTAMDSPKGDLSKQGQWVWKMKEN